MSSSSEGSRTVYGKPITMQLLTIAQGLIKISSILIKHLEKKSIIKNHANAMMVKHLEQALDISENLNKYDRHYRSLSDDKLRAIEPKSPFGKYKRQ